MKYKSPQRRCGRLVDFHLVVSRRSSRAVAVYIASEMLWNESLVFWVQMSYHLYVQIIGFMNRGGFNIHYRQSGLGPIYLYPFCVFCRLFISLNYLDLKEEEDTEDRSTAHKEKASKIDWWDKIWKDKRGKKKQDINLDKLGWNMIVYHAGLPAR